MSDSAPVSIPAALAPAQLRTRARAWWRKLPPHHQDRFSVLAPLVAVILFAIAIIAAFGYLRLEEIEREKEAVKRDVEYTQQRLRLRLLERQEQLMRLARDVSNRDIDAEDFRDRAESLVNQYPELESVSWIDDRKRIKSNYGNASIASGQLRQTGTSLRASCASKISRRFWRGIRCTVRLWRRTSCRIALGLGASKIFARPYGRPLP